MKQFEELTQYISQIDNDEIGRWQIDRENDGTLEHPIQAPFVIYSEMINNFVHDVYALVDQYPTFSRTTVYNSLHALVQAGLVQELAMDTEERRYDADIALHGHFHCRRCGGIADFSLDASVVQSLVPDGFSVQNQGIYFSGLCPACQSTDSTNQND